MANRLKGNEARNRDPDLDKSEEQKQRIQERLKNLSFTDSIELASKNDDDYVRLCAAQAIRNSIQQLEHAQVLTSIQSLLKIERNEWVYNEYLEFLYWRTDDISSYHDQLDLLRKFATNDASELKRWLAMDKLLRVKAKVKERPPWLEQYIRDRVLSDSSNWVRAQIATGILYMVIFDPDEKLKYFALQWALHTGYCDYPSVYPMFVIHILTH